jgi:glutamyl-Q tRNA(Asp) synthetase
LRFAPSPNGYLHLGHAYSALFTAQTAARLGANTLLRIEDIDTGRARQKFTRAIVEDLDWLGFAWQGPVRHQSAHFDDYEKAAARLAGMGLLYRCYCTRSQLAVKTQDQIEAPTDPDGNPLYGGTCRNLYQNHCPPPGAPCALRLDMEKAVVLASKRAGALHWSEYDPQSAQITLQPADPLAWGDVVIVRKQVPTSYHLSVVVDDAIQGITHVTRGRDLFAATAIHRVLQVLLGLAEPSYVHHRLIVDENLKKLAKSKGSTPLRELRAGGWTPARVCAELGFSP